MRIAARLACGLALAVAAMAGGAAPVPLPRDVTILPGSEIPLLLNQCARRAPARGEGSWTPGAQDIARLEAALPAALADRPEIRRPHRPSELDWTRVPEGWGRQYVGIVRGGRRYIYGNFVPKIKGIDLRLGHEAWRMESIARCDGGAVYFGAEYDVTAGRFTQIAFNREG
jgi:hypothetical protein